MKKYIAWFGALAVLAAFAAAELLVWGRAYETAIGRVCCGVLLAVAAVCKETGAFIVPEGWKEGSIELD